jgi:hypothetical protein
MPVVEHRVFTITYCENIYIKRHRVANNVELTGFLGAQRTKFLVKRLVEQSRSAAEKATNQVYYL